MRAVNLLPPDRGSAKRASGGGQNQKSVWIASGVVGALIVTGLVVMVWSSSSSVNDKSNQLEALQSQIASTPSAATQQPGNATKQTTVSNLVANRMSWDQFLRVLSKVMPEDVWLQNLQATTPGAAATLASEQAAALAASAAATTTSSTTTSSSPPPAVTPPLPSTFTISGFTYSQPSVARMMRRLSIVPWLTGVSLVSSSKTSVGTDTLFRFTVKASLVPTPPSS